MLTRWTKEECLLLEDLWGKVSREEIAKLLGKSVTAVANKAMYIGIGKSWEYRNRLSARMVFKCLFGYRPSTKNLESFFAKGCPYSYANASGRGRIKCVKVDAFWHWLKAHKDEFSFLKFEKYSLGWEPKWVDEKRKADWEEYRKQRWDL